MCYYIKPIQMTLTTAHAMTPRGSGLAGEHLFFLEARRVTICCHNPDTTTFKEYRRLGVSITQISNGPYIFSGLLFRIFVSETAYKCRLK